MIIVKDKGAKSPIYVPRNVNLQPSNTNNSGEGGINEDELNKYLEGYITEEELNEALNNIGDTNIVELTQEEYDNLEEKDENTIYVITDAPAIDIPDTSVFATKAELDEKIGDIETILNSIIGDSNGGGGSSIFPLNN